MKWSDGHKEKCLKVKAWEERDEHEWIEENMFRQRRAEGLRERVYIRGMDKIK